MAKVNATKVTFPHTRKRKANAKTDPASTCESWNRTPKKPRYSHKDVSVHVLQQLGAKLNSAKTERNHTDGSTGPSPLHVLDDTISTDIPVASLNSSVVNFKIDGSRSRKGIEDNDTLTPIPIRHSTPVVTALVPQELDDRIIQNIQDLLKQTHPDIGGLQYVGLGYCNGKSLPRYTAATSGERWVQILNVGDHWVCVTNIFGSTTHDVFVFDSLQRKKLSDKAIIQISSILRDDRLDDDKLAEKITIHVQKFVRQDVRSRACGLYAAAASFACCNGTDPSGISYSVDVMQNEITQRLLSQTADNIPGNARWLAYDISCYTVAKVYCTCHRR
jgi:hypothetical protein